MRSAPRPTAWSWTGGCGCAANSLGSRFDPDGDRDGSLDSETDQAYSLLALYAPGGRPELAGLPVSWSIGVEYAEIGSYYRSLANPVLPNDRRALRLFGDASWNGLISGVSLGHETDNVADIAGVPTTATDQIRLQLGYTPSAEAEPEGWSPFARASYSAMLSLIRQAYDDAPAGIGLELDRVSRDLRLSAYFAPGSWSWGLGYGFSDFDDKAATGADSRSHLASLSASVPLLDHRLWLRPDLQWNRLDYPELDYRQRSLLARLGLEAALLPQRLTLVLDLSVNRERSNDDSVDSEMRFLQANLSWSAWQPSDYRPGGSVFLSGSYQDTSDRADRTDEDLYQVFVGINIDWLMAGR